MNSLDKIYDAIEDIASVSSRLSKENKIKNYLSLPYFKDVVIYTYDYNRKYNVTNASFITDHGYELEVDMIFKYLDYLSTLNGASNELKHNISVLSSIDYKTNQIVNRILNKDLKCGASVSIFSKFIKELPIFEIMTCQKNIKKFLKLSKNKEYFCSIKKDGVRVINYVYEDKVEKHLSRSGLEYPNFDVFNKDLISFCKIIHNKYKLEYPILIDGEAIGDKNFNKIMTQIRRIENVDNSDFKLHIFDIATLKHTLNKRYEILENCFNSDDFCRLDLLKHFKCDYNEEEIVELSKDVIKNGIPGIDEGVVIKIYDSPYEFKEKSKYWCKVKPTDTLDLPVTGFYYGKKGSKYEDIVGGLIVDFNGVSVHVGSGLSDNQRIEFLEELPNIIEVEFKEITKDGSLREPIMKSIRNDKNTTD